MSTERRLREALLDAGGHLPEWEHWRIKASSKPSDPEDVRWDCACGYAGSPEAVRRHWNAMSATPPDTDPVGLDVEAAYTDTEIAEWRAVHGPKTHSRYCDDRDSQGRCRTERWLVTLAAIQDSRAQGGDGGLDVAWREVEAALPEGAWLYLAKTSKGRYGAQVRGKGEQVTRTGAAGDTPAAALRALVVKLAALSPDLPLTAKQAGEP